MQNKKAIAIASLAAASYLTGMTPAPAMAAKGGLKTPIEHKGRTIVVSCNALDGHARHADSDELASVVTGKARCKKQAEQQVKQDQEERSKEQASKGGVAALDAELEVNLLAALGTLDISRAD